ncbi:MAG: NfeD family protein, partial [Thermoplasmata archaeon]
VSAQNNSEEENGDDEEETFWDTNYPIALALIFIGVAFLIAEPFIPGFFIAIPGTVLLTIGAIGLIAEDLLFTPISLGIGLVAGILMLVIAIKVYRVLSPNRPPTTTVADSLIGKEGIVTVPTDPDHRTRGKVRIESQIWSAHADTVIPENTKVEVIASEGVHVKIIPKKTEGRPRVRRSVKDN